MAYYECTYKNDNVSIGESFIVTLTGSHNQITTASVCYIDKTTICLLGDINLGDAYWTIVSNYIWNYTVNIKGKEYTGTCKIPTLEQISTKCASYKRSFDYWLSTGYDSRGNYSVYSNGAVNGNGYGKPISILPFIEITL